MEKQSKNVVQNVQKVSVSSINTSSPADNGIQIKGQMISCPESKSLLFLGSPLVDGMDSMTSKGLFLSDIPIHGTYQKMFFFFHTSLNRHMIDTFLTLYVSIE